MAEVSPICAETYVEIEDFVGNSEEEEGDPNEIDDDASQNDIEDESVDGES